MLIIAVNTSVMIFIMDLSHVHIKNDHDDLRR